MMPTKDYPHADVYGNTEPVIERGGGAIEGVVNALLFEALVVLAGLAAYWIWTLVKRWL